MSTTIRELVKTFYATQKLRIQTYNRVVSKQYLEDLGESFVLDLLGKKKFKKDDEKEKGARSALIKKMIEEYSDIQEKVDGERAISRRYKMLENSTGAIRGYDKYIMIQMCVKFKQQENLIEGAIKTSVEREALWKRFLVQVIGCGPMMAAVIMSEFNILEARHVSSFWKYAGLDVVHNLETDTWEGRSRKAAHLVDKQYEDKDGKLQTKKSITYNPFLKTKLIGVLGSSFLKHPGPYREVYDNYKHRIQMRVENMDDKDPMKKKFTPGHIHNMSVRYMIKMFLKDLYNAWRKLEGLEVDEDYWTKYISGRQHGETPAGVVIAKPNYELLDEY